MDSIFHEKQEGSLCAQHCLNALLQGPYFTPVDLASLAQRMDDEERMRMAESGEDSLDYQRFVQQPSGNMDDSGYFSVQVISSALDVWGLDLVPFSSSEPLAIEAQQNPEFMIAYICNYRDHWFTVRKLGFQWFNLNSLLKEPELISDTYLAIFLAQLQEEGYSIFVVQGILPQCPADEELKIFPAERKPKHIQTQSIPIDTDDPELARAIRLSLGQDNLEDEDADLKKALKLSLEEEEENTILQRAIAMSLPSSSKSFGSTLGSKLDDKSSVLKTQTTSNMMNPQPTSTLPITPQSNTNVSKQQTSVLNQQSSFSGPKSQSSIGEPKPAVSHQHNVEATPSVTYEASASTLSHHDPSKQPGATVDAEEIRRRRLAYLDKKKDPEAPSGS